MRRASRDRHRCAAVLRIGAGVSGRWKRARRSGDAEQWLALFAAGIRERSRQRSVPCFAVEQDRPDHRLHVAADVLSGAVVVKLLHDAVEVTGTWIAGHETLDQLAADEWPHAVAKEDGVERLL